MNTNAADYVAYEQVGGIEGIREMDCWEYEQAGIRAAENAWLVAAEAKTWEDEAFEEWELERGCAMDPQSGY